MAQTDTLKEPQGPESDDIESVGAVEATENKTNTKRRLEIKMQKRLDFYRKCEANGTVVIDCDFGSYESEKEIKSLANQIAQAYGFNQRAEYPMNLIICGIEKDGALDKCLSKMSGIENWQCRIDYRKLEHMFNPDHLVYLSADSNEVLYNLSPCETYVIGGIVDRNRLKGITRSKARNLNIQCKRLAIKEHVNLSKSHILSTSAVFHALVLFHSFKDWTKALESAIPKRKFT
ncbi:bifunctional tRNA methyltransferase TRMD-TRM10-type domain/tRNA (guanine(9)-N(1))-methyltransferase TRM10-TRM10A/tRNA (guanine-N1-)-methyltransferase [Babesia duncani]|uniref:tRNA (guanine(9)-N(1))-methyltransferase n=1 Tax=Babesia duncani TaxID=323732 RepID=A0AAD9PNH5_9APIC|nr:bifunctional tRNA methyltransferase TRMD-TRM10-type domain/tRNA (guanine(9)-N(1))-methyltransferase TRM10-TRM10A/tRNA (guanine-N1-)-methyltransferase [Babesia duncani]KAK2198134.1 bifunctional tRNA methyltransferase TRMD-TRM10-type domain/tRNA (guanine(9)-N(1))-methyltransferase TRM10-TRM10A/tRNA (guanine-N1-)-methyltransferase [Babesia duncani]